jgi:hypothetical protein
MRRAHDVLIPVLALATGLRLSAQTAASIPADAHLFLERAYFAPGNPVGKHASTLLFEGDAAAHYFLFNTMDWDWTHTGGWRFAMPVSFMPIVRMSTTISSPVLTPSYRVRPLWFQAIHLTPETKDTKAFSMWALALGVMHYSNGQDGCTYEGFVRDTTKKEQPCVVQNSAIAAQRTPNTRDGDFSTTFIPVGWNWRRGRLLDTSLQVGHQHTIGVEVQINPLGMRPGGIDRDLALQYGRHQINGSYEYEWRVLSRAAGMRRLAFKATFRTPQDTGKVGSTSSAEFSRVYDRRQGFGWFVRTTFGGDYYNIHFKEQSNPLVTFGAMWDQNRIDYYNHIGRPARP